MIQHKYNKYKQKYLNLKYKIYGKEKKFDFLDKIYEFIIYKNINQFDNNNKKNIKIINYFINNRNKIKEFIKYFNDNIINIKEFKNLFNDEKEEKFIRFINVCYYYDFILNKIDFI